MIKNLLKKLFVLFFVFAFPLKASPPDWSVNPANYQFTANITAELFVNDTISHGNANTVAAFVGTEIRGIANAIEVNSAWIFFMTTYSNAAVGETLSFKVYVPEFDAVGVIDESVLFIPNDIIGNPQEPYAWHGYITNYDRKPEVSGIPDQVVEQGNNFQLFDLDDFLTEYNGDAIGWTVSGNVQLNVNISQNNVVTVTSPQQFTGSETLIFTATDSTTNHYSDNDTVVFTVRPIDVAPLISAIPQQTIRIGGAFSPIELDNYVSSPDGDEVTWSYYFLPTLPQTTPEWNVNVTNFQNTMTVTAEVLSQGEKAIGENNILAAFVGNELRGVASAIHSIDKWLFFLTVYANDDGEIVSFRFYDSVAQKNIPVEENIIFSSNTVLGDPLEPVLFHAGNIVIHIENTIATIVKPSEFWIGSESVMFIATDANTNNHLSDSVVVNFFVDYYAFSANPVQLDIGNVVIGASRTDSIKIANYGEASISVISVQSLSSEFTVFPSDEMTILSGASKTIYITFTPADNNVRTGEIIFYHDAASSPDTVFVRGFAMGKYRTFSHVQNDFAEKAMKLKYKRGALVSPPNMMTAVENVFFEQVAKSSFPKGRTFLGIQRSDSAKEYAWMQFTKANDLTKGMKGTHDGQAYPLDYVRDAIKNTKKKLSKNVKFETKLNNPAIAQGILFRLNILASDSNITPAGFGNLILDTNAMLCGRNLQGYSLAAIADYYDSLMTFWKFFGIDSLADYESLRNFVVNIYKRINDGFYQAIDTSQKNYTIDSLAIAKGNEFSGGKKNPYAVSLHGIKSAEAIRIVKQIPGAKNIFLASEDNFRHAVSHFSLAQNYPNPFNPTTAMSFQLSAVSEVTLKIYNVLGQEVATLLSNEMMEEGMHEVQFDASGLTSGVYFYRLTSTGESKTFVDVKKMILMK